MPLWKRIELVQGQINEHVANQESVHYDSREATEAKRKELHGLRMKLRGLKEQELAGV